MIPDKPLNFRSDDLTLDDLIALDSITADMKAPGAIAAFKQVLVNSTDWTPAEIGAIRLKELPQVLDLVKKEREEADAEAVPPQIGNNSSTGQPEPAT